MKRTTNEQRSVAYFSMEIGIDEKISTQRMVQQYVLNAYFAR